LLPHRTLESLEADVEAAAEGVTQARDRRGEE
jgi:hypothetical protein